MKTSSRSNTLSRRILPAMTPRVKDDALFRLKSVLGHVDGVIRMLEREEYCIDVIKQVAAIEVALKKVSAVLLQNHLETCVLWLSTKESLRFGTGLFGSFWKFFRRRAECRGFLTDLR